MSDFAFRIIADVKGYQAELMKIPGATEKSAFAAAQRLALTMEKGGRDAGQKAGKELAAGLKETGVAGATAAGQAVAEAMRAAMAAGGAQLGNMEAARRQLAVNEAMRASMEIGVDMREKATAAAIANANAERAAAAATSANMKAAMAVAPALRSTTVAAQGAAQGLGLVRAGYINLGNQASDILTQLSMGTSPLTVLIQQGPQVAGALDMIGVSASSVGAMLARQAVNFGVLGLAVAALAGTYAYFSDQLDRANEKMNQAAAVASAITEANAKWAGQQEDVARAIRVANGEITAGVAAAEAQADSYRTARESTKAFLHEQLNAIKVQIAAQEAQYGAGHASTDLTIKAARLTKTIAAYQERTDRTADSIVMMAERTQLQAEADERAREAAEALRRELERRRKLIEDVAAASGREVKNRESVEGRIEDMAKAANDAAADRLTGEERVRASLVQTVQGYENVRLAIELMGAAGGASADHVARANEESARATVEAARTAAAEIEKIREDGAKKEAERTKAAEKEAARLAALQYRAADEALSAVTSLTGQAYDQRLAAAERTNQALRDGYGELTRAETEQLQRRLQGQRRASLAWWALNKASAFAQSVVNTELAVSNALASAPPPFNAALAIAAGLAGGLQTAKIASSSPPSFHRGTQGASSRRDEFSATLERGEAVIPKTAARDPRNQDMIARMRGDRMTAAPTVIAVDRYDGRAFGRGIRDQLRAGGELRRAIASTNPHLGHR